jgi:glycogen operon protein
VLRRNEVHWHGVRLGCPDWGPDSHSLALETTRLSDGLRSYIAFNMYDEPLDFELPALASGSWGRWIDTSLRSPDDLIEDPPLPTISEPRYRVASRAIVILLGRVQG